MLINNLQEYKQKYSNQRRPIIQSVRSSSNNKSAMKISKTQMPFTLRNKNESQKNLFTSNSKIPKYSINNFPYNKNNAIFSFKQAARMGPKFDDSRINLKAAQDICYQYRQSHSQFRSNSHQKANNQPKNNMSTAIENFLEHKQKINKTQMSLTNHRFKSEQMLRQSQLKGSLKNKTVQKFPHQNDNLKTQQKLPQHLEKLAQKNNQFNQTPKKNFGKKKEQKVGINKGEQQSSKKNTEIRKITIEIQKTREDRIVQQRILKDLKFNQVFFCSHCFRYIFAIEKNYHYPNCQNMIALDKLTQKQKYKIGEQKLKILVQLAQYTKYKTAQIKALFNQIINNHQIQKIEQKITGRSYYTLLQIQTAAYIIFINLIASYFEIKNSPYLCDNIKLTPNNSIVNEQECQEKNIRKDMNIKSGNINNYH